MTDRSDIEVVRDALAGTLARDVDPFAALARIEARLATAEQERDRWHDAAHVWASWAMNLDPDVRKDVEYAATHLDEVALDAQDAAVALAKYLAGRG